jgi:hypothetical protein
MILVHFPQEGWDVSAICCDDHAAMRLVWTRTTSLIVDLLLFLRV